MATRPSSASRQRQQNQQATQNAQAQARAATQAAKARQQQQAAVAPPPADPAPAPQPYDPAYQAYVLSANRNVTLGNNEATYQTQQTGYDLGYDQTGAFNAANPYSEAQLLQDNYHNQQRGTTNSLANQGQLYSGSLLNQRGIDDRNYSISDAALKRKAQAAYHGIQYGQLQNYSQNAVGVSDAGFNTLNKAAYGG